MTQRLIDRLVAKATGEDVDEIRHRGFVLVDDECVMFDPEPLDAELTKFLDWDEVDAKHALPELC